MTLSIITINYNNCDGLQKTIDSVLAQTWKDFEWIIIDGGSTDGSRELIEQDQEHFAYWCSEPDKGVYNAMNKGIAKAKGEYINFMNSGDTFYEAETLGKVFAVERKADVMYGDWVEVHKDQDNPKGFSEKGLYATLWQQNICHQATFIRAQLLSDENYDEDMHLLADWKWNTKKILGGVRFQHLDVCVCRYDTQGMSSKWDDIYWKERNEIIALYPDYMQNAVANLDSLTQYKSIRMAHELIRKGNGWASLTQSLICAVFYLMRLFSHLKPGSR